MYKVYVLYSPVFRKTYVGFSADLDARLRSHNFLATKGYTVKYRPWVLIYTEVFSLKSEAIRRERELKSGKGRAFIKSIISEKYK
ncbi:MAG: GIY-YIG nuclease family protein [Bacteroidota bacterium]